MTSLRNIRRCAVQALYQFDVSGSDSPQVVRETLLESPGDDECRDEGFALAERAWAHHQEADAAVAALAPDWPTHRQPAVDLEIGVLRVALGQDAAEGRHQ
jgi:transcription termination factor NusB